MMDGNNSGLGRNTVGSALAAVLVAGLQFFPVPEGRAQEACGQALLVHNYPVHDAGAYAGLFEAVEGYVTGPAGERPWPFAKDDDKTFSTRDYCPGDPGARLVRLFEAGPREIERTGMQTGTLTLVARDLPSARKAAANLAAKGPRDSELQGRRSFHFTDAAGNEFFVWEHPGPPSN